MQAAFQKWTFGAFMIASTTPALAQLQETGSNPTSQAEAAPKATAPHIPAPKAEAEGAAVDLSIVYTFDVWHNSRGGIREGTRYLESRPDGEGRCRETARVARRDSVCLCALQQW
ncbi:MAG: hypothetical protein ACM3X2_07430 [Pseudomonadota bacterium]